MAEALEQAKKRLGLNNNKPGGETTDKRDKALTLEDAINQVDDIEARELVRAKAREMRANLELRASQAEEQLRQMRGGNMENDENRRQEAVKLREEISSTAITLLEKGMDPKVVAQYIIGSTPVQPITLAPGAPVVQGFTLQDIKQIMDWTTQEKGSSELKETLAALNKAIEKLGETNSQMPRDPVAFGRFMAEQTKAYYDTLKAQGIIRDPSATYQGEPLEVVKETHRHEEKMEELKTDKWYKQETIKIASSIPERVGRGIASQFGEEGEPGESGSSGLEHFTCTEEGCGTEIYITPETGNQVTCPKCNSIYSRKGTVETGK